MARHDMTPKALNELTREDFVAYEQTRKTGMFNMVMNAREAADFAELDLETYWGVLRNYGFLMQKFPDVRP